MYLSEKDEHLIRKLKKYERRWTYFRWIFLAIGIVIYTGELYDYSFPSEYATALAALLVCHAVINWKGNRYHLLLLKILNESEAEQEITIVD